MDEDLLGPQFGSSGDRFGGSVPFVLLLGMALVSLLFAALAFSNGGLPEMRRTSATVISVTAPVEGDSAEGWSAVYRFRVDDGSEIESFATGLAENPSGKTAVCYDVVDSSVNVLVAEGTDCAAAQP